jgi:hypothetical protein
VGLPNPYYAFPLSMTLTAVLTSRDPPSPTDSHLFYIPTVSGPLPGRAPELDWSLEGTVAVVCRQVYRWDSDSQSIVGDPIYQGPRRALPRSLLKPGGVGKIRADFYLTAPIDILLDV